MKLEEVVSQHTPNGNKEPTGKVVSSRCGGGVQPIGEVVGALIGRGRLSSTLPGGVLGKLVGATGVVSSGTAEDDGMRSPGAAVEGSF